MNCFRVSSKKLALDNATKRNFRHSEKYEISRIMLELAIEDYERMIKVYQKVIKLYDILKDEYKMAIEYNLQIRQEFLNSIPDLHTNHSTGSSTGSEVRMICVGGRDENYEPITVLSMYDDSGSLVTGSWYSPVRQVSFQAVTSGQKLYILGGRFLEKRRASRLAFCFDFRSGRWTRLRDMPRGRLDFTAISTGRWIYVAGGRKRLFGSLLKTVDRYDTLTGEWLPVSDFHEEKFAPKLFIWNRKLCLMDLSMNSINEAIREEYCPVKNEWLPVWSQSYDFRPNLVRSIVEHSGFLYSLSSEGFLKYSPQKDSWDYLRCPEEVLRLSGEAMVVIGDKIRILGGSISSKVPSGRVYEYDIETGIWNRLPDMEAPRIDHFALLIRYRQ